MNRVKGNSIPSSEAYLCCKPTERLCISFLAAVHRLEPAHGRFPLVQRRRARSTAISYLYSQGRRFQKRSCQTAALHPVPRLKRPSMPQNWCYTLFSQSQAPVELLSINSRPLTVQCQDIWVGCMLILISENTCESWLGHTFEEFPLLTLTFRQSLRVKRKIARGNIFAKATVNTSPKHWRASRLASVSFKDQVSSAYWGQKPSTSRQFCPCFSWNCGSAAWTQPLFEGILSNTPFKFSSLLYSLTSSFSQTKPKG